MNEHVDSALTELRWAGNEAVGEGYDLPGFHLKSARVYAMLAVAAEIADLHKTFGAYLEASTHPLMKPAPADDSWITMVPVESADQEGPS